MFLNPKKTIEDLIDKYETPTEPLIAAVVGYSSYQGLIFLEESME